MPVETCASPVPSRSTATRTWVSLVLRASSAFRFMAGAYGSGRRRCQTLGAEEQLPRRAEVGDQAFGALRLAGDTDVAAVQDQPMVGAGLAGVGDDRHQ